MFEARLGAGIGHEVSLPAIMLVGLLVGYIAGMFGLAGGFLLTPTLMYMFGVPPQVAVGSALCQTCGTSLASFLKYRRLKRGEPRIDLVMLGGSLIGVDAGTRLLAFLSGLGRWRGAHGHSGSIVQIVLDVLFILLLSLTALVIFIDVRRSWREEAPRGDRTIPGPLVTRVRIPPYIDLPNVQLTQVSVPMLCYLGFMLGLSSGLMGIGGGVLFMPVLLYGFGLSARNAAGTGILLLLVTVSVGTIEQAMHGFVSLRLAMVILIGSSIGTQLGAITTHYLPNRQLRLIFMLLVVGVLGMIVWNLCSLFRV
ncbi:MAG TPA: sulfite exporter TauE/SafE family protein [Chthonomonadaceae bacterium]|nr:sulfite exporter TauE/SafE family protein [Chthonomonadaceae bacterium]